MSKTEDLETKMTGLTIILVLMFVMQWITSCQTQDKISMLRAHVAPLYPNCVCDSCRGYREGKRK